VKIALRYSFRNFRTNLFVYKRCVLQRPRALSKCEQSQCLTLKESDL